MRIASLLPSLAPDLGGACSMLFPLSGMPVIHDAAGCMENYTVFDEPRWFGASAMTLTSGLTHMEAVLGDEERLITNAASAARELSPRFTALIGSPVPYALGMDLEGMAREVEERSGIPAFGLECGSFADYTLGAGAALAAVVSRFARENARERGSVNIVGLTPLDFSEDDVRDIRALLEGAGARINSLLTLEGSFSDVERAPAAGRNIVVSSSGIPAARLMEKRFGIPYSVGVPLDGAMASRLVSGEGLPALNSEGGLRALALGEAVFAQSVACYLGSLGVAATAGAVCGEAGEGASTLYDEESAVSALGEGFDYVAGDPLYSRLLPGGSKTKSVQRPHYALSAGLYMDRSISLCGFAKELREEIK